jgi:hypothetical protein
MTRRHLDFYPTPPDAARALIEHMRAVCPWMLGEGIPESEEARHRWLDPRSYERSSRTWARPWL